MVKAFAELAQDDNDRFKVFCQLSPGYLPLNIDLSQENRAFFLRSDQEILHVLRLSEQTSSDPKRTDCPDFNDFFAYKQKNLQNLGVDRFKT